MSEETLSPEGEVPVEVQAEQVEQEATPAPVAESAPADAEVVTEAQEAPAQTPDWAQERINKITAQKYEEKRRAEEAERRAAELEAQLKAQVIETPLQAPTLDQFDYDEAAYNAAVMDYNRNLVQQEVQKTLQADQQAKLQAAEAARIQELEMGFLDKARVLQETNGDFSQTLGQLPELPNATYEAILQSEKGAEVAYYLGKHLDVADRLTQMNPVEAGRELYRIESMFQGQPKQESRTPAPPPSVGGGSGATTFDPSDPNIPIDQWIKQMEARDRAKLG